jgi:hypothetical protein
MTIMPVPDSQVYTNLKICVFILRYLNIFYFSLIRICIKVGVLCLFFITRDVRENSQTCYKIYSILLPAAVEFFDAIQMLIQDF